MRSGGIFLLLFGLFAVLHTPSKPPVRSVASTAMVKRPLSPQQLNEQTLETVIRLWQKRMDSIKAAKVRYELIQADTSESRTQLIEAQYQRPGQATLNSIDKENPTDQRKWFHVIMNDRQVWDFDHGSKTVRPSQFEMGPVKDYPFILRLLSSLSCAIYPLQLHPTTLHQQYRLSIDVTNPERYNENFLHILVEPRSPEDCRLFTKAEIVLWINKTNPKYADRWMLPVRIWIQKSNKDQITWDVKDIACVDSLPKETFEASLPGADWK